jgi:ribonucleoside-diphosphate reductase alpha chain
MATGTSQATDFDVPPEGFVKAKAGLKIPRYFTRAGVSPYNEVEWELRNASITNQKGKVVF